MKKCIFFIMASMIAQEAYSQKEVLFDDVIINNSKNLRISDSIRFESEFKQLISETNLDELNGDCAYIDRPKNYVWLKMHSNEIVEKLAPIYNRRGFEPLLALLNLPDSIKQNILNKKNGSTLGKARLGDSLAISEYVVDYRRLRDTEVNNDGYSLSYQHRYMVLLIGRLLQFDQPELLKMVFSDMESTRIYVSPMNTQGLVYYTIPYAVIEALKNRFPYEPIFNYDYVYQYSDTNIATAINPHIKKFYKQVEIFIYRQYKIKVKIKTPYLEAGYDDNGCFRSDE